MRNLIGIFLFVLACIFLPTDIFAQKVISVVAVGLKNDGFVDNTELLQSLVDKTSASGGGVLKFPAGKYLLGPIRLKNNITLSLDTDATILASTRRLDYGEKDATALFTAENQHDISIIGKGIIDGRGSELVADLYQQLELGRLTDPTWQIFNPWFQKRPTEENRPMIFFFKKTTNILVKGIKIKDGSSWIQDYKECKNIRVDAIEVLSNCYWNNDGIDLVDCENVTVANSYFNVADDGICLKSENPTSACRNILIQNCKVRSSASAVKLGTASWGGFEDIQIKNVTIFDTYRSAIAIESVDGGKIKNVLVDGVHARNVGNAIFVKLGARNKTTTLSAIRNITIKNVDAEIPLGKPDAGYPMEGPELKIPPFLLDDAKTKKELATPNVDTSRYQYAHNVFPSAIVGLTDALIQNVVLENIRIVYAGGSSPKLAKAPSIDSIPESRGNYPEFSMFGELPIAGLFVRHVKGIRLNNVHISFKNPEFRKTYLFKNVEGLHYAASNIGKDNAVISR